MATQLIAPPTEVTERGEAAVRVRGLRKAFGDNVVLHDLDLDIAPGELVALLGRSGSGKSTLLRTLAGLDPVQRGTAEVRGTVSVAFQEPRLLPWKRVRDNVALALHDGSKDERRARACEALDEVHLQDRSGAVTAVPVTEFEDAWSQASYAMVVGDAPGPSGEVVLSTGPTTVLGMSWRGQEDVAVIGDGDGR